MNNKSEKIGFTLNRSKKLSTVYLKNNKRIYSNGKKLKRSQRVYSSKSKVPKLVKRKTSKKCAKKWCNGYQTKNQCEDSHHKFITTLKSKKVGSCSWKNKKCGIKMSNRYKFKMLEEEIETIPIGKILHDKAMRKWTKENAKEQATIIKPKGLPSKLDKTVGNLKSYKIDRLIEAYDSGIQDELPPIKVREYGNSGFYEVIDGRHRSVMALKNNENDINVIMAFSFKMLTRSQRSKLASKLEEPKQPKNPKKSKKLKKIEEPKSDLDSEIKLKYEIIDNEIILWGSRHFIRVNFQFKNGITGCQTFYLSSGGNSLIKDFWIPTNGISFNLRKSTTDKYQSECYNFILKNPWLNEKISKKLSVMKKRDHIILDDLLARTDNNINILIISCILSTLYPPESSFNCSLLTDSIEIPKNNRKNSGKLRIKEYKDVRKLADWIGTCNSYNWNPDHYVGHLITSGTTHTDTAISTWRQDGLKIPPFVLKLDRLKKYVKYVTSNIDDMDFKEKLKMIQFMRMFYLSKKLDEDFYYR
jgi:hypothetical protein